MFVLVGVVVVCMLGCGVAVAGAACGVCWLWLVRRGLVAFTDRK